MTAVGRRKNIYLLLFSPSSKANIIVELMVRKKIVL